MCVGWVDSTTGARYTPHVAAHLAPVALVQHSPYDVRDGGAEETAYGVQCLDYMLRSPAGDFLEPDVIMFNWGCVRVCHHDFLAFFLVSVISQGLGSRFVPFC